MPRHFRSISATKRRASRARKSAASRRSWRATTTAASSRPAVPTSGALTRAAPSHSVQRSTRRTSASAASCCYRTGRLANTTSTTSASSRSRTQRSTAATSDREEEVMRRLRGALVLVALSCLVCSSSRPEKGLFDPNPRHPANRLYRNLSTRITQEGDIYDQESIDPVFFPSAKFLTDGESHRQALAALDDFTQHQAKQPLKDPLRRAVLQHDLWGVFVTTTGQAQQEMLETRDGRLVRTERFLDGGDEALERVRQRRKLQRRLAAAMRAIALTAEEIDALPDNLAGAVKAGVFPREFDPGRVKQPFLPADLLAPSGP